MDTKQAIIDKLDQILDQLIQIQANNNGQLLPQGLFPSYRSHISGLYKRTDNSFFFSALISQILNDNSNFLPINLKEKVEIIISKIKPCLAQYQSTKSQKIYNFYPQNPLNSFGNGYILKHFNNFHLANDADDTALAYDLLNPPKTEFENLQKILATYTNTNQKILTHLYFGLENQPAYSTWLGPKMPVEIDVVVLSNILKMQLQAGLKLDAYGQASWEVVKTIIFEGHYLNQPFFASPNYAKTEIIAYHVSKLIQYQLPDFKLVKTKLISDCILLLQKSKGLKALILSNALNELGHYELPDFEIDTKEFESYSYFLAGFLSTQSGWIYQKLAPKSFFHFKWKSPAHNLSIYWEHLCYKLKKASFFS